jgi:hypothetical protein
VNSIQLFKAQLLCLLKNFDGAMREAGKRLIFPVTAGAENAPFFN